MTIAVPDPSFPGLPSESGGAQQQQRCDCLLYGNLSSPPSSTTLRYGFIRQGVDSIGQVTQPYVDFGNGPDPLSAQTYSTRSNVPVHNLIDDLTWVKGKHTLQFGGNLRIITNNRTSNNNSYPYARIYDLWIAPFGRIAGSGLSLDPGAFRLSGRQPQLPNRLRLSRDGIDRIARFVPTQNYNITKQGTAQPVGTPRCSPLSGA